MTSFLSPCPARHLCRPGGSTWAAAQRRDNAEKSGQPKPRRGARCPHCNEAVRPAGMGDRPWSLAGSGFGRPSGRSTNFVTVPGLQRTDGGGTSETASRDLSLSGGRPWKISMAVLRGGSVLGFSEDVSPRRDGDSTSPIGRPPDGGGDLEIPRARRNETERDSKFFRASPPAEGRDSEVSKTFPPLSEGPGIRRIPSLRGGRPQRNAQTLYSREGRGVGFVESLPESYEEALEIIRSLPECGGEVFVSGRDAPASACATSGRLRDPARV